MFNKLIHTSRQYLGLPISHTNSQNTEINIAHRVGSTLDMILMSNINDFLQELVNMRSITIHAKEKNISQHTVVSIKTESEHTLYITIGDIMSFLQISKIGPKFVMDYFHDNFVEISYIGD